MKHQGKNCIPLVMILILMMTGACQTGKKGAPVLVKDLDETGSTGGLESLNQIYHLYPSPAEILSVFDMTEIKFNESLLNPVERADQYLDSKSKSYVLGIYMADLAYAAIFNRHEEDKYLESLGLGFDVTKSLIIMIDVLARGSSEEEIKENAGCLGLLIQYKNYPDKKVKIQM